MVNKGRIILVSLINIAKGGRELRWLPVSWAGSAATRFLSRAMLLALLTYASGAAAESMTLNQCANGGIDDPVSHLDCAEGWIGGAANAQKAAFTEAALVPYRVALSGLDTLSNPQPKYTYTFSWDTIKSGLHALDYIGTYNHSVMNADPCQGLSGALCAGAPSAMAIPADPDLLPFLTQVPGEFTLYGGTIETIVVGDYSYPDAPDQNVRAISVTFTPYQTSAVLLWGGHISSPLDWGDGTTAADINGSPYHVSNISLKKGEVVVANGGQDVALSAAAVYVPSAINVLKTSNKDGTFSFESYFDQQSMPPDGEFNPWTLMRNEEKMLMAYDDGKVTIAETGLPEGDWRINAITCSKLNAGIVFSYQYGQNQGTDSAEFSVAEGGTYNCTFDNVFFGAPVLQVIKKVIGADDACTDAIRDDGGNESRSIRSGESVKYCYWVSNNGSDTALDVTLIDDGGTAGEVWDDVMLTGGSDFDGDMDAPDLVAGAEASGSLIVTHDIALNATVTNVALTTGTGYTDGQTYTAEDTASVTADQASHCTTTAMVSENSGCTGGPTIYALEGDTVYWCANIGWDSGAMLPLTDVSVTLMEDNSVSKGNGDLNPGATEMLMVGSNTAGASDFTGMLRMTGSEGGLNPIWCESPATVDVVSPGLQLRKTVMAVGGTCGVDDSPTITVIFGDAVQYCLRVDNTGDTLLDTVVMTDPMLNLNYGPAGGTLEAGAYTYYTSDPYTPEATVTNTATATANEPLTQTFMGPEMSSATVTVLRADVEVNKSVDLTTIVICEEGDDRPYCSVPDSVNPDRYNAIYTIEVKNNGWSTATGVTLTDTLPEGFEYSYYQASAGATCSASGFPLVTLTCDLGDIDPMNVVTIQIIGQIDPSVLELPWGRITNQNACATTTPPQLDPIDGNNCDSASTLISTGPTRTIGYWGSHPESLEYCTNLGVIDLGFMVLRRETLDDEIDATVSTNPAMHGKFKSSLMQAIVIPDHDGIATPALDMAKGMLRANVSSWSDSTKRSAMGQARTKTSRQLTAAWCNESLFGATFANYVGGWDQIRAIMAGRAYLDNGVYTDCGGPCPSTPQYLRDVIASINWLNYVADVYNNSGHDLPNPLPQSPADPHAPENDPTDPGMPPAASADTTLSTTASGTKVKGKR